MTLIIGITFPGGSALFYDTCTSREDERCPFSCQKTIRISDEILAGFSGHIYNAMKQLEDFKGLCFDEIKRRLDSFTSKKGSNSFDLVFIERGKKNRFMFWSSESNKIFVDSGDYKIFSIGSGKHKFWAPTNKLLQKISIDTRLPLRHFPEAICGEMNSLFLDDYDSKENLSIGVGGIFSYRGFFESLEICQSPTLFLILEVLTSEPWHKPLEMIKLSYNKERILLLHWLKKNQRIFLANSIEHKKLQIEADNKPINLDEFSNLNKGCLDFDSYETLNIVCLPRAYEVLPMYCSYKIDCGLIKTTDSGINIHESIHSRITNAIKDRLKIS